MARRGSASARALGSRRLLANLLAAVMAAVMGAVLLAACTADQSEPPAPVDPANASLEVTTIAAGGMNDDTRSREESEISDVLVGYLVKGFLGDYPRDDFVTAFADFSSRAAKYAVGHIDVLTAAGFDDVRSVRATTLEARLSFLVTDHDPVGGSAYVDFVFDVDDGGTVRTVTLNGRFVLGVEDGAWKVFGYTVKRDDSDALPTEVSSS